MAHSFFQHNTKDNNQSVGMGSLFAHTHFNMAENRDKKNSNIARALPQHKRRPIC